MVAYHGSNTALHGQAQPLTLPPTTDDHTTTLKSLGVRSVLFVPISPGDHPGSFLVGWSNHPHHVPYRGRQASLLLGGFAERILEARRRQRNARQTRRVVRGVQREFRTVREDTLPLFTSLERCVHLPHLFKAQTIVIRSNQREAVIGRSIPEGIVSYIAERLRAEQEPGEPIATDQLGVRIPELGPSALSGWIAGFLYLPLANEANHHVMLLRENRQASTDADGKGDPRSAPWTDAQRAAAKDLTRELGALFLTEHRRFGAYDPLTGLGGHSQLTERLAHALNRAERTHEAVAVLIVEYGNFEAFTDRFEHDAGARPLQQLGQAINIAVRESDTVVRLWETTFAVLLEGHGSRSEAMEAGACCARRIADASGKLVQAAGGDPGAPGVTIGIAVPGDQPMEPEHLLQAADRAQTKAKHAGHLYAFNAPAP